MKGARMATLTTITDGTLSATIDAQGAQLMSLRLGEGEYLWQGDERYWARRAPVLFPIVGCLRNDHAVSAQGDVSLKRHGIARLYDHADRVLIDAPCSGLGVLRRTADSKWADINPRLVELKKVQADILERYSRMVKVGGKVVYSTCSILPSENQAQVQAFLERHPDSFKLEEEKVILPSSGFDGFYMARLVRLA